MKQHLKYTVISTVILLGLLLVSYWLPTITIGSYTLKKIDILADLRPSKSSAAELAYKESLKAKQTANFSKKNLTQVPDSIILFEDFSPNSRMLSNFYKQLQASKTTNVRIGFYGDSFIEGDIITCHFRSYMQQRFGGKGVGFIPFGAFNNVGNRSTILQSSQNITNADLIHTNKAADKLGIAGLFSYFQPTATANFKGVKTFKNLDSVQRVTIIYKNNSSPISAYCKINGSIEKTIQFEQSNSVEAIRIAKKIGKIHFSFTDSSRISLHGIYFDDTVGVSVDNFGMRAHSGVALPKIPLSTLRQTDSLMKYSLIILEFGLNVVETERSDYNYYKKQMKASIAHIKKAFPNAAIVLCSVGDRSTKENGAYVTMPGILHMVKTQREIAKENGIIFWNMFEAMGGINAMDTWVNSKPAKAAKDYTHITYRGGQVIAKKMYESLMFQKKIYDKK